MSLRYPNISPPAQYLGLVGYICAWWQQIEFLIETTIWRWAGLSQKRGRCLTAHMAFPLKCSVLRSLANAKFNDPRIDKTLGSFVENELKTTQNVRNRFAHALWLGDDKTTTWLVEKPDRFKPDLEISQASFDEMSAACAKILRSWAELMNLLADLEDGSFEPDTWRKKPRPRDGRYDQIVDARSRLRAMRGKRPRRPRSSRE